MFAVDGVKPQSSAAALAPTSDVRRPNSKPPHNSWWPAIGLQIGVPSHWAWRHRCRAAATAHLGRRRTPNPAPGPGRQPVWQSTVHHQQQTAPTMTAQRGRRIRALSRAIRGSLRSTPNMRLSSPPDRRAASRSLRCSHAGRLRDQTAA